MCVRVQCSDDKKDFSILNCRMQKKLLDRANERKKESPFGAVALVEWLWEETCVLKTVGLNPSTIIWMDIFDIYLL